MKVPIVMPQLGESIAEATIVTIGIEPGGAVDADQELFEVETNKATMGVTSPCSGRVVEITARLDESYVVGAVLGFLEVTAEEARRAGIEDSPDPGGSATAAEPTGTPGEPRAAQGAGSGSSEVEAGSHFRTPDSESTREPTRAGSGGASPRGPQQVDPTVTGLPVPVNATGASYISPRLRARMHELGINAADLAGVAGSGAAGRVTVEDFERFMAELESQRTTMASPMRIAVADSMRRSWTRPLATVGAPVALDAMLAHRRSLDPKPGPALYAIRALALTLAENTAAAGRLVGQRVVHPPAIDIGFAVEVADGVLVPVIRDVDQKPLRELVEAYNDLVDLARRRRLPNEERRAGIATVTNFGTFGIVWATPIPLPEQNLVLGLGMGRKQPHWDEESGTFVPVTEAQLTLSFDHRLLDGGGAGRVLARVGELLQRPEQL